MRQTRNILLAIVFAPLWLVLLTILSVTLSFMCIPATIQGCRRHRRWKRKLAAAGRIGNPDMLASSPTSGTLIVDRATLGWNTTYLWWTPRDIADETEIPVPTDEDRKQSIVDSGDTIEHPFDRWCYDQFLSTETGTAILISPHRGERLAERLRNAAGGAKLIVTWSGWCRHRDYQARGKRVNQPGDESACR